MPLYNINNLKKSNLCIVIQYDKRDRGNEGTLVQIVFLKFWSNIVCLKIYEQ